MSEFSQMMSDHIAAKEISVPSLAQYCSMDRSYLYKIIRGKRTPSDKNTVLKIAEYLHLTPKEQNEFLENWKIAQIGAGLYYRRRSVFNFLDDFPFGVGGQNQEIRFTASSKTEPSGKSENNGSNRVLYSKNEIETYLLHLFLKNAKDSEGSIRMLLPPDKGILHLFSYLDNSSRIRVEHVFAFDKNNQQDVEGVNYNLNCIRNILPLYTYSINYESYYFYGDPIGQVGLMHIYPYLILVEEEALLLSENLQSALILKDPETCSFLGHMFKNRLNKSKPVARRLNDTFELLEYLADPVLVQEGMAYAFQLIPCLTAKLTPEMLKEHLTIPSELLPEFMRLFGTYLQRLSNLADTGKFLTTLSEDGVRQFMKTGRAAEYPYEVYTPLSMEERRELVRSIINTAPEETIQYRMLRENIGNVLFGVDIYVNQNAGYAIFRNPKNDQIIYLDILETSVLSSIYDYLETMDEELFYSDAEMKTVLRQILRDFEYAE